MIKEGTVLSSTVETLLGILVVGKQIDGQPYRIDLQLLQDFCLDVLHQCVALPFVEAVDPVDLGGLVLR